ncbi:uncharacterized protein P174DRAFT_437912 [Aspergillus novofumigatus IBT 16806]|uniref:Uncharacterized protein n=1 Tax=Aspergillus novofumigatus (strain IBT 16806) TaxID=1392255 RepID=A0A2I1CPA9_ASPN1|nr:uncharacterized protein P174DRAFT_437912 [Aspergillus novofumigatus IBT 16806]PKX99452.1 hypothetical protein P174DRAFT_437912 [Aspergillus novofumigatus IBT 16806]
MQRSVPYQHPISGESALQETGDDFNRSSAARRSKNSDLSAGLLSKTLIDTKGFQKAQLTRVW